MTDPYSVPSFTMADYGLYRLDDRVFYALAAAALAFCLVHAARRAFRQPGPTEVPSPLPSAPVGEGEMERHTLFQRIFHWSNAAAVFILAGSGWLIYRPGQAPGPESSPSEWFLWHRWGVALLLPGIAAHIFREAFLVREENPMAFNRKEVRRILAVLKNFFGLSKHYPLAGKYHPGQLIFHWAVAANLLALVLTGMALWKPLRDLLPLSLFGLGWDFIYFSRVLHAFFSATLLAGLIGHLYFALFIKKNWPEAKSMVTGRMSLRQYLDSHARPQ